MNLQHSAALEVEIRLLLPRYVLKVFVSNIIIQWFPLVFPLVPTISISYGTVSPVYYSSVYPAMNTLSVPSAEQDVTLLTNIEGKWNLPNNSNSANSILTIPYFSSQNNGVYKFYITNWDGVEVCALQIILLTGTI